MDSITQGLLGAAIAEAGFRHKLGGRAVAFGAFCGVAPDLDMVAALAGEWATMVHHRGVSHSWVMETLAAPILGWLAWRFIAKREGSWWHWAHLAWWALVTHPALDLCTAYGTQLFAPISTHRYAIDAVSIVDLAYSVPLFVAALYARFGKIEGRSRRVAIGALVFSTLYLGVGWVQSQRAIAWAEEDLTAQAFESVETRALPSLGNILVYRVIARDARGRYRVTMLSHSTPRRLEWIALQHEEDPLVERTMESDRGRMLMWFGMDFSLFDLEPTDEGWTVRVRDLRFGRYAHPDQTFMGARFEYDREGNLLRAYRRRPDQDRGGMGEDLAALWSYF